MNELRIKPREEEGVPVCDFGQRDCPYYEGPVGGGPVNEQICRHPEGDGCAVHRCVPGLLERAVLKPRRMKVYTVVERPEAPDRGIWLEVGVASQNRDGSLSAKLEAVPVSGAIQIRESDSPDFVAYDRRQRDRIVMLEGVVRELLDGRPGCGVDALIADYDEKRSRS